MKRSYLIIENKGYVDKLRKMDTSIFDIEGKEYFIYTERRECEDGSKRMILYENCELLRDMHMGTEKYKKGDKLKEIKFFPVFCVRKEIEVVDENEEETDVDDDMECEA